MATTALTFTALRPFGRGMQRRSAYALLRDEPAFVDTTFDFWAERLDRLRTFVDVSGLLQTDVVRHFLMFAVGITASDADMIVYHFEEPGSDVVACDFMQCIVACAVGTLRQKLEMLFEIAGTRSAATPGARTEKANKGDVLRAVMLGHGMLSDGFQPDDAGMMARVVEEAGGRFSRGEMSVDDFFAALAKTPAAEAFFSGVLNVHDAESSESDDDDDDDDDDYDDDYDDDDDEADEVEDEDDTKGDEKDEDTVQDDAAAVDGGAPEKTEEETGDGDSGHDTVTGADYDTTHESDAEEEEDEEEAFQPRKKKKKKQKKKKKKHEESERLDLDVSVSNLEDDGGMDGDKYNGEREESSVSVMDVDQRRAGKHSRWEHRSDSVDETEAEHSSLEDDAHYSEGEVEDEYESKDRERKKKKKKKQKKRKKSIRREDSYEESTAESDEESADESDEDSRTRSRQRRRRRVEWPEPPPLTAKEERSRKRHAKSMRTVHGELSRMVPPAVDEGDDGRCSIA